MQSQRESGLIVFVTVPSKELGQKIAKELLEKELASCVQILPAMESHFVWQGRVEKEEEFLLLSKTTESNYESLEDLVVELHPYEVPQVVALRIDRGHGPYLSWLGLA